MKIKCCLNLLSPISLPFFLEPTLWPGVFPLQHSCSWQGRHWQHHYKPSGLSVLVFPDLESVALAAVENTTLFAVKRFVHLTWLQYATLGSHLLVFFGGSPRLSDHSLLSTKKWDQSLKVQSLGFLSFLSLLFLDLHQPHKFKFYASSQMCNSNLDIFPEFQAVYLTISLTSPFNASQVHCVWKKTSCAPSLLFLSLLMTS